MSHRQRLLADRFMAAPIAFLSNVLARILGAVLRRDHVIDPTDTRQIVVAKLVGMGSAVQATALLRAIKREFPGATLTFVTLATNRPFIERLEHVDQVVSLDDRSAFRLAASSLWTLLRLLRARIDLYFDLEVYSAFACLIALYCLPRNRIGFYRRSCRFKRGIYTHLVYFNTSMPVRRLYLQLIAAAGAVPGADDSIGPIRVDVTERLSMRDKLTQHSGWKADTPYLVMNPNASDLLLERRWPAEYVTQAVSHLASQGRHIVLVGSSQEAPYVANLYDSLPDSCRDRVANVAGLFDIGEFLALLEGGVCVITNDTGPMHMAIAMGLRTVCLFGPGSPGHYGFEQEGVVVLYAPVLCSPCLYEIDEPPCQGDNICMQRLTPSLVIETVETLLGENNAMTARSVRLPLMSVNPNGAPLGYVVRGSVKR